MSVAAPGVIVVGIDGSPASRQALRFALTEARLRGARLQVVHAWHYGYRLLDAGLVAPLDPELLRGVRRAAGQLLEHLLAELVTEAVGVEVEPLVGEGQPAQVLLEAAQAAELLVVGSRGRGGFAGLLLGSVSQQCAQHAPCPVVIVRPQPEPER